MYSCLSRIPSKEYVAILAQAVCIYIPTKAENGYVRLLVKQRKQSLLIVPLESPIELLLTYTAPRI